MTKNLIDTFWEQTTNKEELFKQYFPQKNFADISFDDIKEIYYKIRFASFQANFLQQISKINASTPKGKAKITEIIADMLKASKETNDKEKKLSYKEIDYLSNYYETNC